MSYRIFARSALLLAAWILAARAEEPDFHALDRAFGVPLWVDDDLWDDGDGAVARRLQWSPESRTTDDASFRRYAGPAERVLGARPFSLALYGKGGMPSQLSMVFANKGDSAETKAGRVLPGYKKQIAEDGRSIAAALTGVLGPPEAANFGQGARTREHVDRWNWKGHAILLAAPRGEYVAVRVMPVAMADGEAAERVTDQDLRARLASRVERRPNGDVILRDIPMVDQGPKGYCVPATWERALRYLGIPADMYVLAMAAQTDAGGGTSVAAMIAGAGEVVRRNGRRLVTTGGRLTTQAVAGFIDAGLPVLWGLIVIPSLDENITNRSRQRREASDWSAYREMLKPWRKNAARLRTDPKNGHMCMIIGYNVATAEVAISDSWGPGYAERWITVEEANAVSQGQFTVVNW